MADTNAAAEATAGTGTAADPQGAVSSRPSATAGTGVSADPTVSSTAPASTVSGVGTSAQSAASVKPPAVAASSTGTVPAPTPVLEAFALAQAASGVGAASLVFILTSLDCSVLYTASATLRRMALSDSLLTRTLQAELAVLV